MAKKHLNNPTTKGLLRSSAAGATNALGRTHGAFSRVNQIAVMGGVIAGGLAALGALPVIGRPFKAASKLVLKPGEILQNTTVSEAGHAASSLLDRVKDASERRNGADSRLTEQLARAQASLRGAEERVGSGLKAGAINLAQPLGNLAEEQASDVLGKVSGKVAGGANKHHQHARELLGASLKGFGDNPAFEKIVDALGTAHGAIGDDVTGMDSAAVRKALAEASGEMNKLPKDTLKGRSAGKLRKGMEKTLNAVASAEQKQGLAGKMTGLPDAIKNAPDNFAKANLSNVALKGAAVTGTAFQLAATGKGIGEKVHVLKQMHRDLTGETKISTRKLLFGKKVPAVVKEARGHIFKEYGPQVLLNFANTAATYTFMKNSNLKSMAGSFGLMSISSIHSAKVANYGILPLYEILNQLPEIQDVHYAAFITAASQDARDAGGIENPLVQAVAMQYAEEGLRPAGILQEIESGRFDRRAMELMQQQRAAVGTQESVRPGADLPAEIIGAHTQRLQQEQAARPQHAPNGR